MSDPTTTRKAQWKPLPLKLRAMQQGMFYIETAPRRPTNLNPLYAQFN